MNQKFKAIEAHTLTNTDGTCPEPEMCTQDAASDLSTSAENINSASKRTQLFTATAVHDLRGHLNLISSGISLLRRNYEKVLDVKGGQILIAMSGGITRMKALIDDILNLSKASEKCHRLELVDLNEQVRSVFADLEPVIETNHARVSIEQLPVVCGDKVQLYQVFQNLVSNALKYRKPQVDPDIKIRCKRVSCHEVSPTDYSHEITVEDKGIGFTEEQAGSIFDSFHRLNNPGIEGSGLGLSICQRIIISHRGSIRAEGKPGVGAKFIFQLPSIECCEKSDHCPFAASSYDEKCPALHILSIQDQECHAH